jgi:predicted RND superfamily exporter protein
MYIRGTAPGESDYWMSVDRDDTCMRVLLRDHTYDTLNRLRDRIAQFLTLRGKSDPVFQNIRVTYLGGIAGLYTSANDVLYEIDFVNISFVLGVVFLFCTVTYRSFVAGLLFIVSCIAANFTAFIYMRLVGIGITIDTIPVISLGIGLGVDYGIYVVSRICDECAAGRELNDAVTIALRETGAAVFATFSVIVAGLAPWVFSPVLFHNEMSVLLMILMFTNMVVGVFILPAYIAWARPRFVFGHAAVTKAEPQIAAD